jgi:competence protein ComFB
MMEIRNIMEERVLSLVNEICDDDEEQGVKKYCTSPQCRLDAACYVLNRIPQRYITSGRGFAYLQQDLQDNIQLQIDMVKFIHEGLQRVTSIQRSFYADQDDASDIALPAEYYFFLPTIRGRLFNGANFEPLVDVDVMLTSHNQLALMVDNRWSNPYKIAINTPGTYLFWPHPIVAESAGIEKVFEFVIELEHADFEPFRHYVSLPVVSEATRSPKSHIRDYNVNDLFVMPRTAVQEMEWSVIDDEGRG